MNTASPTNSPRLHNRYLIIGRLGDGRLATVFRAEDERLQRTVLVHLMRAELASQPNLRQRFEEEARRGAQRSHPGLLDVYDSGDVGGRPFMVTEDVAGGPLSEAGHLGASEALGVVRTVVGAVALAQSQGVPHPPISSSNVWLLPTGRAVLVENWNVPANEATRDLAPYRAPERAGGAPPSPGTTVYALGVLAWEAFAGHRPPVGGRSLPLISEARPLLFSPELDRIIAQAVAPDPALRYPAPVDFGRALDHYADASSAQTGRLVTPAGRAPAAEPVPVRQRRPFGRRSQTSVAPAVALPPPPPVIRDMPETRPVAMPAAQYDQRAMEQRIRREVRSEVRRQGCQRAIIKRGAQLLFVFLFLYASWLGLRYAFEYATGRLQAFRPGEWIAGQLPQVDDLVPSWLRDPGELTATYRVNRPARLRSEPGATDDATIVRVIEPGTRVQQLGPPVPDPVGQPYSWLRVIVLDDGTRGWIANLEGLLETP